MIAIAETDSQMTTDSPVATTDRHPAAMRLETVRSRIAAAALQAGRDAGDIRLIAVSKTFAADEIRPVITAGHHLFGENRVQEAAAKWPELRRRAPHLELHLVGPLQSNKVKDAVALFDVIHSVDRDKIAAGLAREIAAQSRAPRLLVQVNTGAEPQKAGVPPEEVDAFVARCRAVHGLDIGGLMCIPPLDDAPAPHFALLARIAERLELKDLSMGMSSDFEAAIAHGSTMVRVGTAIFGARDQARQ